MERLLVVKLEAVDCEAEVLLNGIPLGRADAARSRIVVPAHEFTLAGENRLELVVWPAPLAGAPPVPPKKTVADGRRTADAWILLPRQGQAADETQVRSLAHLSWAPPAGETYTAPVALGETLHLPVNFPRWRWLDAPVLDVTPTVHAQVLAFVQAVAVALARGDTTPLLAAARLRLEELASAYLMPPAELVQRWQDRLRQLHADGALGFEPIADDALLLRPVAGGRLVECLNAEGQPALTAAPDAQGHVLQLPLRVTVVEGKVYALR